MYKDALEYKDGVLTIKEGTIINLINSSSNVNVTITSNNKKVYIKSITDCSDSHFKFQNLLNSAKEEPPKEELEEIKGKEEKLIEKIIENPKTGIFSFLPPLLIILIGGLVSNMYFNKYSKY